MNKPIVSKLNLQMPSYNDNLDKLSKLVGNLSFINYLIDGTPKSAKLETAEDMLHDGGVYVERIEKFVRDVTVNPNPETAQIEPLELNAKIVKSLADVREELTKAMKNWPAMNSAHEGYGVLLEEVDELWDHVKTNQKKRDVDAMRKECIQVAAMALRFAIEICDEGRARK